MKKHLVAGHGVVGSALQEIISDRAPPNEYTAILHICFPYSNRFYSDVATWQMDMNPDLTIIHSTVPIGTTASLHRSVHSPVMGRHNNMKESLLNVKKWVGGSECEFASECLQELGIHTTTCNSSDHTEALKLLSLSKYGVNIAFAQYQAEVARSLEMPYEEIMEWDLEYNKAVTSDLKRPILYPPGDVIGGHCVIPGVRMMQSHRYSLMLREVLTFDEEPTCKVWEPCNIYPTAVIGHSVNIGAFSEVGPGVVIGNNVRIGAMCFIPEGVIIEENAWVGPRVTFSNDKYPPSGRDSWRQTKVCRGARIGAATCVLPGVTIGENAVVGMGSVVVKDVKAGVVVIGNPAKEKL